MNTDKDQAAQADLDHAREAHAAALLASLDSPGDPQAQQQFRETVKAGRRAWKGYQQAATASLAAQIDEIVPGEFH